MTDGVGTFDPGRPVGPPALHDLRMLVTLVGDHGDAAPAQLTEHELQRLAPLVRTPASHWTEVEASLSDDDLEALIRFLTLAEARLPGWEAGADASVITLFGICRSRGVPTRDLARWIREHSNNRFLPHGSLQARL